MKKGFLGSLATLLSGAALTWAQPPPSVPITPSEAAAPAPTPAPAAEPEGPPVDRRPWNPSLKQGAEWPYPAPPHAWHNGLCLDLGDFWLSADYLLAAMKGGHLPALVTVSPINSLGILGRPGTSVLIGDMDVNRGGFSGGHFAGGVWLDDDQIYGFEGTYFFLAERSANFDAASTGGPNSPTLMRPFFNVLTNREEAQAIAFPFQLAGSITVTEATRLQGAEATEVIGLFSSDHFRLEMLIGFRYLDLDDKLRIAQESTVVPNAPSALAGTMIDQADQFDVQNHYYAGQLGIRAEGCYGRLLLGLVGKLALGANEEASDIAGVTRSALPGRNPLVSRAGLLALSTNSGHFAHSRFAVVPEVGIRVGYQVAPHLCLFAGYTFLYWSDVARSGDQIDRSLNATQIPASLVQPPGPLVGPARPAFSFRETDFWAQGGTFGLEFRY